LMKVRLIPFRAAKSKGDLMLAVKPDKIEIWKENEWNNIGKVLIGIDDGNLSSDGTYQAIIHPSCLSMIA
jgi:stage II sporulation protein GA (sporulation sigma-E factor processing peptidase)